MKTTVVVVLLLTLFTQSDSQSYSKVDSLKKELDKAKSDTVRIRLMHFISFNSVYARPDSSMWYAQKELQLAEKIKYRVGEARGLNDLGNVLYEIGNNPKGLETLFRALQISEEINDAKMMATSLGNIGEAYAKQEDYRHALDYTFQSKQIDEAQHDDEFLLFDFTNIGNYYEKMDMQDSALQYQNLAYQLCLRLNKREIIGTVLYNLGSIQFKMGNYDLSLPFYHKSVFYNEVSQNYLDLNQAYLGIANLFLKTNEPDSTIFYTKKALTAAQQVNYLFGVYNASNLLFKIYDSKNNDSALKYLKLTAISKDSLFSQEKTKQVQSLTFTEQLREQEIATAKTQEEETRRRNLQLMGIAVFIPVFFAVILFLSKRKVKVRTIEFLALLGLLLLFEFISMFIHPFIEEWTNQTPVYMLLILVAIAAVLIPTHHRLTDWVKEKLWHKNKMHYTSITADETEQVKTGNNEP